ncbi:MAG TPA: hypothetical protein PLO62_01280 [Candidatus Hydrogenedentes bacterium]|nr:hypothetical protein [Candidatus Hydrogenedentota bacterium]
MDRNGHRAAPGNTGYTLIEMLLYCALLCGLLNLCTSAYISTIRVRALNDGVASSSQSTQWLTDDFVRTVRAAVGVGDAIGPYAAGTDTLILEVPPDEERRHARQYVVFARDATSHRLFRSEYAVAGNATELVRSTASLTPFKSLSFERSNTGRFAMRFAIERHGRAQRAENIHTVTATMRVVPLKRGV